MLPRLPAARRVKAMTAGAARRAVGGRRRHADEVRRPQRRPDRVAYTVLLPHYGRRRPPRAAARDEGPGLRHRTRSNGRARRRSLDGRVARAARLRAPRARTGTTATWTTCERLSRGPGIWTCRRSFPPRASILARAARALESSVAIEVRGTSASRVSGAPSHNTTSVRPRRGRRLSITKGEVRSRREGRGDA